MGQSVCNTPIPYKSNRGTPTLSPRQTLRAVRQSIDSLREAEQELFAQNPSSTLAISLANLKIELERLRFGQSVRVGSIIRVIIGFKTEVPLKEPVESTATMRQPACQ